MVIPSRGPQEDSRPTIPPAIRLLIRCNWQGSRARGGAGGDGGQFWVSRFSVFSDFAAATARRPEAFIFSGNRIWASPASEQVSSTPATAPRACCISDRKRHSLISTQPEHRRKRVTLAHGVSANGPSTAHINPSRSAHRPRVILEKLVPCRQPRAMLETVPSALWISLDDGTRIQDPITSSWA